MKNNSGDLLKALLPHIIAVIAIVVISMAYFYPQLEGKVTVQGDVVQSKSMVGENTEFSKKNNKTYQWNNGMFCGMPRNLLNLGAQLNKVKSVIKTFQLYWKYPIGIFITAMLTTYFVLVLMNVPVFLALLGGIAFAFNVNNFVLWEAGHYNKLLVLSFMPLVVGGLLLVLLRQKYLLGGSIFGVGLSIAIFYTHIQMVYYMAILLVVMVLVYSIIELINKNYTHLLKSGSVLLIAALLGALSNFASLYSSKQYSEDTMRGKPILKQENAGQGNGATSSSQVEGLEWNYAMQWSNGFNDLYSILVPRVVGGSSAEEVGPNTAAGALLKQNGSPRGSDGNYRAPMYWGALPFTSGPYYLGASFLFIFVLSLFYMKRNLKVALLVSSVCALLISMGDNAAWFNRPIFEYLPLFSKFRAHNSIMVVLPIITSICCLWGLSNILKQSRKRNFDEKAFQHRMFIALAATGGLSLILAILGPGLFDFMSDGDTRYQDAVRAVFVETRKSILRMDAFRSFLFAGISAALIWYMVTKQKSQKTILHIALACLVLVDLWPVGKRYLDSDNFVEPKNYEANFEMRPIDEQIKSMEPDGRGYYRVLDLSINTFNSASTSMHHNTIGGYHAAKLQRYQDMIDYYISKMNRPVLNMLNTKYIINQQGQLQVNPDAFGNAWFVDTIVYVETPNQEIEKVGQIDPAREAVIMGSEFPEIGAFSGGTGEGEIKLVEYEPDRLVYRSSCSGDNLAVFSEVWYGPNKGWTATIDGKPTDIFRADYLLRAVLVPAGEHEVVLEFKPTLQAGVRNVTLLSSWLLLLAFLGVLVWEGYQWYNTEPILQEEADSERNQPKNTKSKRQKPKKK